MFKELGNRLERGMSRGCSSQEDSGARLARTSQGLEIPTVESSCQGPGGGHLPATTFGSGGSGTSPDPHPEAGSRHSASLPLQPKDGRHDGLRLHLLSGPIHPNTPGPGSMDSTSSTAGQCHPAAGRPGLQARDSSPQPGGEADQGSHPWVLRLALGNRSNYCYMNTVVQVLAWIMQTTQTSARAMGRMHSFFISLQSHRSDNTKFLMQDMVWRMLISGWADSQRQHDTAEFFAYLAQKYQFPMLQGTWQARRFLDGVLEHRDSGQCTQPIVLRLPAQPPGLPTTTQVQSLVDYWSGASDCIVALLEVPHILLLQLDRFQRSCGRIEKRHDHIEANRRIVVPYFSCADLTIEVAWYKLVATISHRGTQPNTGHYTSCLVQGAHIWSCDDNRGALQQDTFPMQHTSECYILVYQRCAE